MITENKVAGPVEVWLTVANNNMGIECRVVREDETVHHLEVNARSMRGAQRDVTGYLLGIGYQPVARWVSESGTDEESVRMFKPGPEVTRVL